MIGPWLFLLAPALFIAPARADTVVAKRIAQLNQLIELEKVTVGPDDQYHGSVSSDGRTLVFTHKADLVPHLERQDLATGEVTDLLALSADSEEPILGPGGPDGKVAFTYYKFNARGDICTVDLPEKPGRHALDDSAIRCLKRSSEDAELERSNPFWVAPGRVGYLTRDIRTQLTRIVSESADTGEVQVLADGRVWSPAMKPGGRYLFYNELVSDERALRMKDLQTGEVRSLRFALPGLSGFPAVSDDEAYLYFSHYLNDTNGDNVIDGADNSVVFRMPISAILAAAPDTEAFPEQLTSVESNCSFPRPFGPSLYVTCAFEGALDIYRLPATGIVPAQWDEKLLENSHQTSRSYEERILLLDTMKYRLKKNDAADYDRALLADHLLADDTAAARFYVNRLSAALGPSQAGDRHFYQLLTLYLEARELKKSQPSPQEVTPEFRDAIAKLDERIARVPGAVALQGFPQTLRGLLQTFLNRPHAAVPMLRESRRDARGQVLRPLERYFQFELAAAVLPFYEAGKLDLLTVYRDMTRAPELTEEEHIYYAFDLLARIKDVVSKADALRTAASKQASATPARERIRLVERAAEGMEGPVATLLKSEIASLRLIESPDDPTKSSIYSDLDKLMSASKSDYFLRKALYVRAILNFADAAEFKYLEFIANNWLRYTQNSDTEFAYAREVFAGSNTSNAYAAFAKGRYQLAGSFFFGSLSLTDDLESHDGYIRSLVLNKQRKMIDTNYKFLQQKNFIDDNMKYVNALLILVDAEPAFVRDRSATAPFDQALALLESMSQERNHPLRYLMMGYCRLEKLRRTADGYVFDEDLFQQANRDLMLAYDLGRENDRIKASALMDLGLLHERAQNHGLATRFFGLRERLGFVSEDEEAGFRHAFAQALFYDHQPDRASSEIALALQHAPSLPPQAQGALRERRAFYLMSAERFKEAESLYAELLRDGKISGDRNLARAWMSEGYCLFKLSRVGEAQAALHSSLELGAKLDREKRGGDRLVNFEPVRIALIDYGLLSRMGTVAEREAALEKRGELLPEAKDLLDAWSSDMVQNRLQLAHLYGFSTAEGPRAQKLFDEAISYAKDFGDANQYLGLATFRAAAGDLIFGIEHPNLALQGDFDRLQKVVERCLSAYHAQKQSQSVLDTQELKLRLLWSAYLKKRGAKEGIEDVGALFSSDLARRVRDAETPQEWRDIEKLRTAVGG